MAKLKLFNFKQSSPSTSPVQQQTDTQEVTDKKSTMSAPVQVEYRQLGKSGIKVSVPVLGAMSFGSSKWLPWVVDEDKSLQILKHAWERGINTIDTANVYSNGESERVIGKWLKQESIPRQKVLIITKVLALVGEEVGMVTMAMPHLYADRNYINQYGLSRASIFNNVEASLQRLGTSYIDVLFIHRHDPDTPPEETMHALNDLVVSGKVRYLGASSMRAWQLIEYNIIAERHGWFKFTVIQPEYSLLYREEEREMLPYCAHAGIGVIPWSPQAAGVLTRPIGTGSTRENSVKGTPFEQVLSDADKEIINRVEALAKKKGWTMGQVALAWSKSKTSSPIVGVNSIERLDQAILTDKNLSEDEIKHLEEPYVSKAVRGLA